MSRQILLSGALVLALVAACTTVVPPNLDGGGSFEATAVAPATAKAGDTVELVGSLTEGATPASLRWNQTLGYKVELTGEEELTASFVAPSLFAEQRLTFRLDARSSAGTVSSAEVSVLIEADPNAPAPGSKNTGTPDDSDPRPKVRLVTTRGTIVVELNRDRAPITVENFLKYVDSGFYNDTIIHRVVKEFVIQGGGFDDELNPREGLRPAIVNEGKNGLKNDKGTIGMARSQAADSATSQFYINLKNNDELNANDNFPGYAVFGKVVEGLTVVEAIGGVETGTKNGFQDVPTETIRVVRAERVQAPGTGGGGGGGGGGGDDGRDR